MSGQHAVGDPINIASGNLCEIVSDFAAKSVNRLTNARYYNSDTNYISMAPLTAVGGTAPLSQAIGPFYGRFGYGWRSEYDRYLIANGLPSGSSPATAVDAMRADGDAVHFIKSGSSWYAAYWNPATSGWSPATDPRHDVDLRLTTDGTNWYVTDGNDVVDTYDAQYDSSASDYPGKLISIRYRNGYQQTLTYDAAHNNTVISDSLSRQISFTYLANGLVDTFKDPDNNITHYSYLDRSGLSPPPPQGGLGLWVLQKVTYADTKFLTYAYEDVRPINRFALTGITDESSNRFSTWAYDDKGRATSSQHGTGGADLTTISYDDTGNTRTVTNALGKQFLYHLSSSDPSAQGQLRIGSMDGLASAHTPASTVSYLYDSNGFVSQETSAESRITKYTHNALGQETSRIEGYGSTVQREIDTTWDPTYRVIDKIVEPNLTIDFSYPSGLLTQMTETDTTTQTIPYSTNGQTRVWNYTYYPTTNLLHTIDGPLPGTGDTVSYGYNANGYVNSYTDELGHLTQIPTVNGFGAPTSSIDPNNITTNYGYDVRGRLKTVTVNPGPLQAVTHFDYYDFGQIQTLTLPNGTAFTYFYDDAHRLTSIQNSLGEKFVYTLDAMGGRTKTVIKNASGTTTKSETATFDELARILKRIGAASQTTKFAYDKDNNLVQTTDPRSKVYGHAFDALNRLYQETDPDLYQTVTQYNGKDEPISVTDPRLLATGYVRDGFGDVIQQASPDTGTTVYYYDQLGGMTRRLDARGVETDFTYDAKGRVKTRKVLGVPAEDVTYTYDTLSGSSYGVDRLGSFSDPSGSTAFSYNRLGYVTKDVRVLQAKTYTTSYTPDAAGNVLNMTYPSGRIVAYGRDSQGRISGITTRVSSGAPIVTIASAIGYAPFGTVSGLTFGNGLALGVGYDQDYQVQTMVTAAGATTIQNLSYGYDPAGNINPLTDTLTPARSQSLTYDDLNRVQTASGLYGSQSYGYDASGNRSSRVAAGVSETYAIDPASNRIATVTTGSNVRSFSWLPTGQASNDNRDPGHAYVYGYNNTGRLASASLNGSTVASYLTNGAEQRVVKTAGSTVTHYIYDRMGHLLAEAMAPRGAVQKEYIWLDDLPVAVVDETGPSPVISYIHTDALGAPQKLTDSTKAVVWDGAFDPFGNPASLTGSITSNLRFPGQYFDAETALHQNWTRDYDPSIGRYIEDDLLGLNTGINMYEYSLQNPLVFLDWNGVAVACSKVSCGDTWANSNGSTLTQNTSPKPPECSFYEAACRRYPNIYYCDLAPMICRNTPDVPFSDWTICTRVCLQKHDKECHSCEGTDSVCIAKLHFRCWVQCTRGWKSQL